MRFQNPIWKLGLLLFICCLVRLLQIYLQIMSGNSILKDGCLITERYGTDLEKLNQDDRVGLMRTSDVSFETFSL